MSTFEDVSGDEHSRLTLTGPAPTSGKRDRQTRPSRGRRSTARASQSHDSKANKREARRRCALKVAKVGRAELFERTDARRPIRVQDLRATFVTLSLAIGKSEMWVSDRTGHKSSVMHARYRRAQGRRARSRMARAARRSPT